MKKLNLIQKIILLNKVTKSWKASKKLIDSKKGLSEEVKKVFANIKADLETLVALLPDFKEVYNELRAIIENVF